MEPLRSFCRSGSNVPPLSTAWRKLISCELLAAFGHLAMLLRASMTGFPRTEESNAVNRLRVASRAHRSLGFKRQTERLRKTAKLTHSR
jgi:hypothetical protein